MISRKNTSGKYSLKLKKLNFKLKKKKKLLFLNNKLYMIYILF